MEASQHIPKMIEVDTLLLLARVLTSCEHRHPHRFEETTAISRILAQKMIENGWVDNLCKIENHHVDQRLITDYNALCFKIEANPVDSCSHVERAGMVAERLGFEAFMNNAGSVDKDFSIDERTTVDITDATTIRDSSCNQRPTAFVRAFAVLDKDDYTLCNFKEALALLALAIHVAYEIPSENVFVHAFINHGNAKREINPQRMQILKVSQLDFKVLTTFHYCD